MKEGLAPANYLLIRGAGKMGEFPQFSERYGLSGSVIAAATLIVGIGKVVGFEHIPVPGATGSVNSDVAAKVRAALAELGRKDFVLMNSGITAPTRCRSSYVAPESGLTGSDDLTRSRVRRGDCTVSAALTSCRSSWT